MRWLFLTLAVVFWVDTEVHAAVPAGCTLVKQTCVEGEATRTIAGYPVKRSCWRYRSEYTCKGPCDVLQSNTACTNIGYTCVTRDAAGKCQNADHTFQCTKQVSSSNIKLQRVVDGQAKKSQTTPLQCGSQFYCPTGTCDKAAQALKNGDFAKSAAYLGLFTRMGKDQDGSNLKVFAGKGKECGQWTLNTKNCCVEDGWLLDYFGCNENEKQLAKQKKKKLHHQVGTYCSNEIKLGFIKKCVSTKTSYCTFNSKFARILQVQGRSQLGMGWGTPQSPECNSLKVTDLVKIDFSKLDLSELFQEMIDAAKVPSGTSAVQTKINNYYTTKGTTTK